MSVLRLGVVGTGPWAASLHVPAALASPRVELTAVFGRSTERAVRLAGEERACTDLGAFLDRVDAVAFAVPPDTQARIAIEAARAGKHLLLEKPVAFDPAAATAVRRVAEEVGVRSVVFLPHVLASAGRRWLEGARRQGGWRFGRIEQWSSLMRDPGDPFAASAWRHERGGLWDVGPHAIAQLCAALGRIVSVVAHRGPGDLVVVRLAHEEGAISELVVAADVAPGAVRSVPLRLVGEAGEAHSPVLEWSELVADAHDRALGILTEPGAGTPLADARFGEHLTTVLDAAERSVRSRRVEPVPV